MIEALLLGGVPNPLISLNATVAGHALSLARRGHACNAAAASTGRVLGFVGWRLSDGSTARGIARFDELMFEQRDFVALPSAVRAHIAEEAAKLTNDGPSLCGPAADRSDAAAACGRGRGASPLRGPNDPRLVRFDPAHDDAGCFQTMQSENNCYNYGTDVLTDTFAQPGRGSGVCARTDRPCVPNTCEDVRRAAVSDGLVDAGTALPSALPRSGHFVSLHIWPKSNFHWLRMDADGTWSHKPGGSRVRDVDNRGRKIVDPAKADVSPWSTHCGYLLATPSNVTLY